MNACEGKGGDRFRIRRVKKFVRVVKGQTRRENTSMRGDGVKYGERERERVQRAKG